MPAGHRTESKTSQRRLAAWEKQRQALELRMAGRTWAEIATTLGYRNHTSAIRAVDAALEKTLKPTAEAYRALTLERLTKVLQVHWTAMLRGNMRATDRVLRAIKDMRDLLGLDAPQKLDIRVAVATLAAQYGLSPEELLREAEGIIVEAQKQKALPAGNGQ